MNALCVSSESRVIVCCCYFFLKMYG